MDILKDIQVDYQKIINSQDKIMYRFYFVKIREDALVVITIFH